VHLTNTPSEALQYKDEKVAPLPSKQPQYHVKSH